MGADKKKIPRLRVKNLSVIYRTARDFVHALADVSFSVSKGQSIGLWGHSGCGKSTIMKALLGLPLDDPGWVSGDAWCDGQRVAPDVSKYIRVRTDGTIFKNSMGFFHKHRQILKPYLGTKWRSIFQEPIYSFDSERPVGTQVEGIIGFFANSRTNLTERFLDEYASSLSELGLESNIVRRRQNLQLSGGECQRIALATNIVGEPELLLADEPTTAMDYKTREKANAILAKKTIDTGMSLIIASHNRDELLTLADAIAVLCKGVSVESLSKAYLKQAPVDELHPYTRKLWHAVGDQDASPPSPTAQHENGSLRGCPYAAECPFSRREPELKKLCTKERPPFFKVGDGHTVSCWLYREMNEAQSDTTGE